MSRRLRTVPRDEVRSCPTCFFRPSVRIKTRKEKMRRKKEKDSGFIHLEELTRVVNRKVDKGIV